MAVDEAAILPRLNLYPTVKPPESTQDAAWADIERLAEFDPACRSAIVALRYGLATKEQLLVQLVFHHYNSHAMLHRQRVDDLMAQPPRYFIVRQPDKAIEFGQQYDPERFGEPLK